MTAPSEPGTGTPSGWMPAPKCAWQSARVAAKSASRASSWVMTTARGIPTISHSCHRARLWASAPSAAETTKRAASAALSPARTSPTKSGLPGASRRVTTTDPLEAWRPAGRSWARSGPRGGRPGTTASTTWSNSLDFPDPLGPTRTTLRMLVVPVTVGAWVVVPFMPPTFHLFAPPHKRTSRSVTGAAARPHYAGPTMLNRYARAFFTKLLTPVAAVLLRLGISPDVVTIIGTLGVCFGALAFYPRGELLVGTLVITAFVFSDTLDGIMARKIGRSGKWGAYLDSTLDRVGDAAIFGGLVLYFAGDGDNRPHGGAGAGLPHPRQRRVLRQGPRRGARHDRERRHRRAGRPAGRRARRHRVRRAGRLPWVVLGVVLALLALASLVTVVQRMLEVRRQALDLV